MVSRRLMRKGMGLPAIVETWNTATPNDVDMVFVGQGFVERFQEGISVGREIVDGEAKDLIEQRVVDDVGGMGSRRVTSTAIVVHRG